MTLAGIDVSTAGQGTAFNWAPYKGKVSFAFCKVSQSTNYGDPAAGRNLEQMRSLGLVPGGYHFLDNEQGGAAQAEAFLSHAKAAGFGPGCMLAVDVEDGGLGNVDRASAVDVEQALIHFSMVAAQFTAELQKHHRGYWPPFYTEISIAPHMTGNGNCPLWLANPSGIPVKAIGPWKGGPSFEQTGQRYVDTDVFYGDLTALRKLAVPG